jgi:AcrR family transcriptional regulator
MLVYTVHIMRNAILEAASELYRSEGAAAISMRRVAGVLGIAPNTIYRHFANKDDLLETIAEDGRREFAYLLHEALAAPTPRARFDASVDAYLRFVIEQPDHYFALFVSTRRHAAPPLPEAFRRQRPPTFQFLVDRIEECMGAGVFRRDDSIDVALTCWSQIHGFATLYLSGFFAGDTEALVSAVRRSFDHIISGLAGGD